VARRRSLVSGPVGAGILAGLAALPVGVFLQVGIGKDFWINILLTLLGYIPGIVHAVWIIAKK
jgi:uncharacterized membrane protein YqaE (UPF0057 family)